MSHALSYHRATALAILSENDGSMALKMPTSIHKALQKKLNLNPLQLFAKRDKNPTPLQLLVKEMPGETFKPQSGIFMFKIICLNFFLLVLNFCMVAFDLQNYING